MANTERLTILRDLINDVATKPRVEGGQILYWNQKEWRSDGVYIMDLIDEVRDYPPEQSTMTDVVNLSLAAQNERISCGTGMCCAGWAEHLWWKPDMVAFPSTYGTAERAQHVLDLSESEAAMLFRANNTIDDLNAIFGFLVDGDEQPYYFDADDDYFYGV